MSRSVSQIGLLTNISIGKPKMEGARKQKCDSMYPPCDGGSLRAPIVLRSDRLDSIKKRLFKGYMASVYSSLMYTYKRIRGMYGNTILDFLLVGLPMHPTGIGL